MHPYPPEIFPGNGCTRTHPPTVILERVHNPGRGRVEVGGFQVEPGFPRSSYGVRGPPAKTAAGRRNYGILGGVRKILTIIWDPETLGSKFVWA